MSDDSPWSRLRKASRGQVDAPFSGAAARGHEPEFLVVLGLALIAGAVRPVFAQASDRDWATDAAGEVAFTAINGLLGGVTAGLLQGVVRGGSFRDGFARGTAGGVIVYAGKRLAAESFDGAGFLGREVAATGSSIVDNAGRGLSSFHALFFPVGPLHLYVTPAGPSPLSVEVDLYDVSWIVYGLAESRLEFDVGESLSAGAPVFRARRATLLVDDERVKGAAPGGVVFLSAGLGAGEEETLAHERTHVIQHDFIFRAWTGPLEHWIAGHLPRKLFRERLDFDVTWPALAGLVGEGAFAEPLEIEAEFLEGR